MISGEIARNYAVHIYIPFWNFDSYKRLILETSDYCKRYLLYAHSCVIWLTFANVINTISWLGDKLVAKILTIEVASEIFGWSSSQEDTKPHEIHHTEICLKIVFLPRERVLMDIEKKFILVPLSWVREKTITCLSYWSLLIVIIGRENAWPKANFL